MDLMPPTEVIFGRSKAMRELRQHVALVAAANAPLVITGESGTGKDVIARLVHQQSGCSGTFVKVNCPAIPGTLLETELFGYEKGAFTGASATKQGRVEIAERGTLFLDEVTEVDITLQAKLLQLLQDGRFCRIGGHEERSVHLRVICASNRDLLEEVALGRFREDLYFRVNVLSLRVPSLRERSEDIPLLVDYFLRIYNRKFGKSAAPLSPTLMRILQAYSWPGNVRELENLMKRYVVLGSEEAITSELRSNDELEHRFEMPLDGESVALKELTRRAVARLERTIILRVLQAHQWNRKRAAAALQISYRALLYKLKEVGVPPSRGCYAYGRNPIGTEPVLPVSDAAEQEDPAAEPALNLEE